MRHIPLQRDHTRHARAVGRGPALRRGVVGVAFAGMVAGGLAAASEGTSGVDAEQPIHWRADHAEGDAAGRTILTGAVRMDRGGLRVEADRMVIEYDAGRVVRVEAEGDLARYRQQPEPDAEPIRADAERIVYDAVEERVELIGRAYLAQQPNEFRGEVIHYDVREGRIDAEGDGAGSVEMIWQPGRDEEAGPPSSP